MNRTIPELWLEQYALGELSEERRVQVETALGEELPAALERIAASNQAVLKGLPPRVFASRVALAAPSRRSPWRLVVPVLAAAAVLLAAPALLPIADPGSGLEVTRMKGDAMLQVYRRTADGGEPLKSGDVAGAGEVLQVSYTSGGAEFGAIGSIDGRGVITWHLPLRGHRSVVLQQGSGVPLSSSYELDEAPDAERFFFVTSPADFDLDEVEDSVEKWERGTDLQLVAPLRSTVFTVRKAP